MNVAPPAKKPLARPVRCRAAARLLALVLGAALMAALSPSFAQAATPAEWLGGALGDLLGTSASAKDHDAQLKEARAALGEAIEQGADELDLEPYDITLDELNGFLDEVYDNPRFYYLIKVVPTCRLDSACSAGRYNSDSGDVVLSSVEFTYVCAADELPTYRATFEQALDEALASFDPDASDFDKVLAVHDWLSGNCTYYDGDEVKDPAINFAAHTSLFEYFTAYGALVNGRCVCDGYSYACMLLLDELGVECEYVSSESMRHSWNMVCLDGAWYHLDCTWDDSVTEDNASDRVAQDSFLRSDAAMESLGYYDWTASHEAPADYPLERGTTSDDADVSQDDLGDVLSLFAGVVGDTDAGYGDELA